VRVSSFSGHSWTNGRTNDDGRRPARIGSTMTATTVAADTAQIKRLVEFASDVFELANQRPDLELRELVDHLHGDLLALSGERWP
jgi:hypothetical protein